MSNPSPSSPTDPVSLSRVSRLAGWCAYLSVIVSVFGIVFLVIFFTTFIGWAGTLNDIAVAVQYTLMLPIAVVLQQRLSRYGSEHSRRAMQLGIGGMVAVILLQLLLVLGLLPFALQIGPVIVAFLVVLAWFVMNGRLARGTDLLPDSTLLHVLAGLYIGYPIWAILIGRRLLSR